MANKYVARAPKRQIERVNNRINQTITNAPTDTILHTVEDRKTLVRAIIQLNLSMLAAADFQVAIQRAPRGIPVVTPAVAQALDSDMSKEQIWEYTANQTAAHTVPTYFTVDLKSMRKLDPGDTVLMRTISSAPNSTMLHGTITLFFKE